MQWLDRTLLISPVHYGLCKSKKEFKSALKHLGIPKKDRSDFISEGAHATVHYFTKGDMRCCIVCINGKSNRPVIEIVGLLTHEAVHIWQEIKDSIGEHEPSREFEAYSIQFLAQSLIGAYWEDDADGPNNQQLTFETA